MTAPHFAPSMNGSMPMQGGLPQGRMLRRMQRLNRETSEAYSEAFSESIRFFLVSLGRPLVIGIDIFFGVVYGNSWMPFIENDIGRIVASVGLSVGLIYLQIMIWSQINTIGLFNCLRSGLVGTLGVLGAFAIMAGETLMDVGGGVAVALGPEASQEIFPKDAPLGLQLFLLMIGAACALNEPLLDMKANTEERLARRTERNAARQAQKEIDKATKAAAKEAAKQRKLGEKTARKQGSQPAPMPTQAFAPPAQSAPRPTASAPSGGGAFGSGGSVPGFGGTRE